MIGKKVRKVKRVTNSNSKKNKFVYYKQNTDYSCGAASMRMVLTNLGINRTEKQLIKLLQTSEGSGTWNRDFPKLAEKCKLNYVVGRNGSTTDLKKFLDMGYLVIVCYYNVAEKEGHYSVVKEITLGEISFWDPWFGPDHKYKLTYFNKIWHNDPRWDKEKHWYFAAHKSLN